MNLSQLCLFLGVIISFSILILKIVELGRNK